MASVARVVEAVGVGAYLGGATIIDDKSVLVAAGSILTIEARHQSFLNVINGANSIPQAFDIALTPPQVLALAGPFVQGCDLSDPKNLGIAPNDPFTITNNGTVAPGTKLTFDSPAIAKAGGQQLSCHMLKGGDTSSVSLPLNDCIVPNGINGPVAIFLSNDTQPLSANINLQNKAQILAGPAITFIDSQPDSLGSLVRKGSNPVPISNEITPDQANAALSQASGSVSTGTDTTAAATIATGTDTTAAATDAAGTAPAATESSSSSSDATATPAQANSAPTNAPAVSVVGVWSTCVSFLSPEALGASTDLYR